MHLTGRRWYVDFVCKHAQTNIFIYNICICRMWKNQPHMRKWKRRKVHTTRGAVKTLIWTYKNWMSYKIWADFFSDCSRLICFYSFLVFWFLFSKHSDRIINIVLCLCVRIVFDVLLLECHFQWARPYMPKSNAQQQQQQKRKKKEDDRYNNACVYALDGQEVSKQLAEFML